MKVVKNHKLSKYKSVNDKLADLKVLLLLKIPIQKEPGKKQPIAGNIGNGPLATRPAVQRSIEPGRKLLFEVLPRY